MRENWEDPHAPNQTDPPREVNLKELGKLGVEYYKLDPQDSSQLEKFKTEHGYSYMDKIKVGSKVMPEYEKKKKILFEEHLHTDDEVRFIIDGSGYFDVRDLDDRWIRILVEKGDLITIPAGIYHRFINDEHDYVEAARLFVGEPIWTPHNRPADQMPARKEYLGKVMIAG